MEGRRQDQRHGCETGGKANPLEEAGKDIKDFLAGSSDKVASGKLLFSGLFDILNAQRSSVLMGLERVTRKQREAAEKFAPIRSTCRGCRAHPHPINPKSTN